ncbi:MAG: hypothetical protein V3S41_00715, partial [Spirochaetia bacterium]
PIVGVAIDGGYHFASVASLRKSLKTITYRVALVGVFDPGTTKHTIGDAVDAVQNSITRQINEWRNQAVVRG